MAVDKKKRNQRRKRKVQDKIRKGRKVYFPPIESGIIFLISMEIENQKAA